MTIGIFSTHLITRSQENHHLFATCAWHSCNHVIWLKPPAVPHPSILLQHTKRNNAARPPPISASPSFPNAPKPPKSLSVLTGTIHAHHKAAIIYKGLVLRCVWGEGEGGMEKEREWIGNAAFGQRKARGCVDTKIKG